MKEKEKYLLQLRDSVKQLEVQRKAKAQEMQQYPRRVTIKVNELERKVISDLTMRRDHLVNYLEELRKVG